MDARWIDLDAAGSGRFKVNVGSNEEIDDLVLAVEELSIRDGKAVFDPTGDNLTGFTSKKVKRWIEHEVEWEPPAGDGLLRLVFFNGDGTRTFSTEILKPSASGVGGVTGLAGSHGSAPKHATKTVGSWALAQPFAIRAVENGTITDRMYGGKTFSKIPRWKDLVPVAERFIKIKLLTRHIGASRYEERTLDLKTDKEGYLYFPELGINNPESRVMNLGSRYMTIEDGHLKPQFSWLMAFVSDNKEEIEARWNLVKQALKNPDKKIRVDVVQNLCDNVIESNGSLSPLTLFRASDSHHFQVSGDFRILEGNLPLNDRMHTSLVPMLLNWIQNMEGGKSSIIEDIEALPEIEADNIYKYDYASLVVELSKTPVRKLVEKARNYFRAHPKDTRKLSRFASHRVLREVNYALSLHVRKQYLSSLGEDLSTVSIKEYRGIWKHTADDIRALTPKVMAVLTMGLFDHYRVDVGFKMLENTLGNLKKFYATLFSGGDNGSEPSHHSFTNENLGRMCANLALEYFVGFRQATRRGEKTAVFDDNFKWKLAPLGIFDAEAEAVMKEFRKKTADATKVPAYLMKVAEGKDRPKEKPLRELVKGPVKKAISAVHELSEGVWFDTFVDIRHQNSLFEDFPEITRMVYQNFGIRFDPTQHPLGAPVVGKFPSPSDCRSLFFGEWTMLKGGGHFKNRAHTRKSVFKILEFAFVLGAPELLLAEAGAAILIEATQGLIKLMLEMAVGSHGVKNAYTKAIAGLDSPQNAEKKKTTFYFETVFNTLNIGVGTFTQVLGSQNPLSWTTLDGCFSKAVGRIGERSDIGVRAAQKVMGGKFDQAVGAFEEVVEVVTKNGAGFIFAQGLDKVDLNKITVKDYLNKLYLEAYLRHEIGNAESESDPEILDKLERPMKKLHKIVKFLRTTERR